VAVHISCLDPTAVRAFASAPLSSSSRMFSMDPAAAAIHQRGDPSLVLCVYIGAVIQHRADLPEVIASNHVVKLIRHLGALSACPANAHVNQEADDHRKSGIHGLPQMVGL